MSSSPPPAADARFIRFDDAPKDPRNVPTTGCDQALARGRSAARRGDWAGATGHFARAVGCDAGDATARGEFGHALLKSGDPSGAIGALREAEGSATDGAVARAIAHNLAAAYEATKSIELARRARIRAAPPSGAGARPEGTACPVLVVPAKNIERGTWLEAHAALAPWDEKKPSSASEARQRTCWTEDTERALVLGECEGDEWSLDTSSGPFQQLSRFVWRLSDEHAAFSVGYTRGGTFCPTGTPSFTSSAEGRRFGDFLLVAVAASAMQHVADPAGTEDMPCVETGVNRSVDLFDIRLGRGFSLTALARDVRVELHPEASAVTLHGRFCNERIALASLAP